MIFELFVFWARWFLKFLENEKFFRLWTYFCSNFFRSIGWSLNQLYDFLGCSSSSCILITLSWIFQFIWITIWVQIYQICTNNSHICRLQLNLFMWFRWNVIFIYLKYWYLWFSGVIRRTIFHLYEIDAFRWLRRILLHQSNRPIGLINSTWTIRTMSNITFTCNWRSTWFLY